MKNSIKYIGSFLMAIISLALGAQTQTENHVVSKTYKVKSQTSLNTQNPDSITTAIQYFDGLGRAKQSVLVKGGGGNYENNVVPYDWELGNSNQSSFYNIYGSVAENQVIKGATPFGDTDLLWECVNDATTGADGGWTTDYISVDISKPYRYSMWIKRTGNRTDGTIYFGGGPLNNMDGSANANSYFWIGDLPVIDTWYLLVGYVHPSDYTGADLGISGVYDTGGNKVLDGTEFKWRSSVSDIRFNNYLVSATDLNTRQYFWSPVVQQINGNEDSLNDIITSPNVLNNQEIVAKDIVTHIEYDGFGRQAKEYLPYASTSSDGRFNDQAKENTQSYYLNKFANDFVGITDPMDVNAFAEKVFKNSPLNRIIEQMAPGKDWAKGNTLLNEGYSDGNSIKSEYAFNTGPEIISLVNHNFSNGEHDLWNEVGSNTYVTSGMTVTFNGSSSGGCDLPVNLTSGTTIKISYDITNLNGSFFDISIIHDGGSTLLTSSPSEGLNFHEVTLPETINNAKVRFYVPYTTNWGFYLNYFDIREKNENYASTDVKKFNVLTTYNTNENVYNPQIIADDVYIKGDLSKVVTKDENWVDGQLYPKDHTTEEYKDKQGRVILKRTFDNGVSHETYYLYDSYGNLTYVLPPNINVADGISQQEIDNLGYQYKYDQRKRLVEKKIPGKGWESIVYDKLDRPIITSDSKLTSQGKWLFTKYDALGRIAYSGMRQGYTNRVALQNDANNATSQYTYRSSSYSNIGGINMYYSNAEQSFPLPNAISEVYTINYYDTYIDLPTGFTAPTSVYGQAVTTNTKSLATVSKVRVLGTNDWTTTVTYYDDKARPMYVYSQNDYLQTTDIVESKLDFTGKVLETKTTHKKTGQNDVITVDVFEYDHMDRLLSQTKKVNDFVAERIVKNNYDDLGQLKSKLIGDGTQKGYTDVTSGITISQDVITKTGATGWNEGMATLGKFNGNGYIEFYALQLDKRFMVGLSSSNANASYTSIDYALYIRDGEYRVYESNIFIGNYGQFDVGDHFSVERVGSQVFYKRNGDVFYISQTASSGELLGDVSMDTNNAQIKNLHIVDNSKGLQNVDYTYNVRGWLKNINEDAQNDNDLFNFTLRYNDPTSGTALFNGNISQTSWNTANVDSSVKTYTYTYDALNRITSGIDNTGNYNLTSVSYDKNGNILTLQREGHTNASATTFGVMDNLFYTYNPNSNQLSIVRDDAPIDQYGFKDDALNQGSDTLADYAYDANGNMVSDTNKGITNITYNHLNLPIQVTFELPSGSTGQKTIDYIYDASGVKLKKRVNDFVNGTGSLTETIYAGNYVYEKVISSSSSGGENLQFFNHAEGYTSPELVSGSIVNWKYVYQYKDHLGNVRLSYNDKNNDGHIDVTTDPNTNELVEESNYYPFGLKHKGYNNVTTSNGNSVAQKKLYNGKEFQDELGLNWHDYGARNYDASLGRFMNIDPAADNYQSWTPYHYVMNNPVIFVDPTGMFTELFDQEGNKIGEDENGKDGNIAVVTDSNEVDRIKKNTGKGTHTESSSLKSTVKLPSAYVRARMGEAVDRSNSPNESVGDIEGGFHEEGGTYGTTGEKRIIDEVVDAKPGPANANMGGSGASIDVTDVADPDSVTSKYKVTGTFHVHPKGVKVIRREDGSVGIRKFKQTPSVKDRVAVQTNKNLGSGNHYVLGARSGQVYIFNSKGQNLAKIPLKVFRNYGVQKK